MLILAIETSCDETALAVARVDSNQNFTLLSEVVSSQEKIHAQYGGIVPELAAREHLENLPILFEQVLKKANLTKEEINYIAVTQGPGLKGCLLTGFCFAEGLAMTLNIPRIGINHIEGHIFSPFISKYVPEYPFLALVVSGGHTELILVKEFASYELIARTSDDAAGEAFDKSASLLGFEYPGGPALAKLADTVSSTSFTLPKVMREAEGFSFSGLKTAISLLIKKNKEKIESCKAEICYAIQQSIVDALIFKTKAAIKKLAIKNLVLVGGVAANTYLREQFKTNLPDINVIYPNKEHCVDNAAMIAYAASHRVNQKILENAVYARWPVQTI